jgi:heme-degrading monooxygenase HmoA
MNAATAPHAQTRDGAVTVIHVLTPTPGKLDELVALQTELLPGFRGKVPGLRRGHFYKGADRNTAVLVSVFDTREAFDEFRRSALFAAHRDRISPLLERTDPGFYELVYETGPDVGAGSVVRQPPPSAR